MATKWIHKESVWDLDGEWKHDDDGEMYFDHYVCDENSDGQTFIQWLDSECEDGWEVLKIYRNFQSETDNKRVLFRKQVRID